VSGKCQIIYGAGDYCTEGNQCFSGTCTNSACTGVGEGGDCSNQPAEAKFAVCATNLYCKNTGVAATCEATLTSGAACQPVYTGGVPCPAAEWCTSGKCAAVGSVASGGNCSSALITNPDAIASVDAFLCASGLAANVSSGLCVTGKAWSLQTCKNNTDCASVDAKSECICNPNGKGYCTLITNSSTAPDSTGISAGVSLLQCLAKANCSYNYMTADGMLYANNDPNSCAVKNCNSNLKKFNSAPCDFMKPFGSCAYLPYCSGFPVWAIIVIVVVAILLVLAVVFVIFLVLRKRRDFSSI